MEIYKSYYHGSGEQLQIGTILVSNKGNSSFRNEGSHLKLEVFRPNGFISRENCVYMTDNIEDIDNAGGFTNFIYIVKPIGSVSRHDLNWMSEIDCIVSETDDIEDGTVISEIKSCALNYWNGVEHDSGEPVWEYLCSSAKVISEVEKS